MSNGNDGLIEQLRRELAGRGVSEESANEFLDNLRKLLRDSGASEQDLEDLARRGGQIFRAAASGAAGGDDVVIRELLRAFSPVAQRFLEKLLDELLESSSGYDSRFAPDVPDAVEKINESGITEDRAPRCTLLNKPKIECVDANTARIRFKVVVVIEELPLRKLTTTVLDLDGTKMDGERIVLAGKTPPEPEDPNGIKDPRVPAAGEEGNDDPDDTFVLDFAMDVACDRIYRNGGIVILRLTAEDIDGNLFFYLPTVSMAELLLDPERTCCRRFRAEDLIGPFIDRLKNNISIPDREKYLKVILDILKERPNQASASSLDAKVLRDPNASDLRIDMRSPTEAIDTTVDSTERGT